MFVSGYQHHRTSFANLDLIEANPYGVHDAINDLHRRAAKLAPRFSDECAESSCTNLRPTSGRRQQVWDMHAEALAWNMISDHAELVAAAVAWLREGLEVTAGADYQSPGQVLFVTSSDGRKVVWTDRIHQVCTAYNEAGIAWATSGGKVWPADSAYDAECEPCVKGFAHIHPTPQAPLFEVVAEVTYDEATDALVPQEEDARAILEAGDGILRCPECDTYSGHFSQDEANETVVHSICGREGSFASFVRGTRAYDEAAGDDDYNGYGDGDPDEGYVSPSWGDEGQGGEADEDEALGIAARTFANALSTQAWTDLAPHLTCREAEAAAEFLRAVDQDVTAIRLLEAHGASDEEGDAHWQA